MKHYTLCLHDMCLPARLGIFPEEITEPQTVEITLELTVDAEQCDFEASDGVPCYATLAQTLAELLMAEHTPLCEQLAQRIACHCFNDQRIIEVEVEIIKPQAVSNARAGVRAHFQCDEKFAS
ncbi:MAG: dihydroneopterin aldolase [Alphaproteobacteria bacterium]|nr:dihydroneopterin aldolase [Alphaproteobacteria bacterium]